MESGDSNPWVFAQFVSDGDQDIGERMVFDVNTGKDNLIQVVRELLNDETNTPYALYIGEKEIVGTLQDTCEGVHIGTEETIKIRCQRLATYRVSAVTRVHGELPGHTEAVIAVKFSPDSRYLASGSGDATVRVWEVNTVFCFKVCKGHNDWVLCLSWTPDGSRLASGCRKGVIYIWDPVEAVALRKLTGHRDWITSLSWEPYQRNPDCRQLASASKDCTIRLWDTIVGSCLRILSGHGSSVTVVRWAGNGNIYSGSQDRTIRVWKEDGTRIQTLVSHAHWVNCISLNTDDALLRGPFSNLNIKASTFSDEQKVSVAQTNLSNLQKGFGERLVSGSDDKTAILWHPERNTHPVKVMTGHQQTINDVAYSPNGKYIATASFDHSVKLWDAATGAYVTTFRGHVRPVYQIAWSPDSRYIISGSADSTLKIWSIESSKLELDLPGHADEVYAVDWLPNGRYVASAGKDRVVKVWMR